MTPPVNEMEVAPVGAVNTNGGVGPQLVIAGGVELLTVTPEGKLSLIETFVRFVSVGAKMSILNLEVPPASIVVGENDLMPAISVLVTTTFAFAGRRLPTPWFVVTPPAEIVFLKVPADVPDGAVTSTDILQVPGVAGLPGGIVPPLKRMVLVGVETVPPQELSVTLTMVSGAGRQCPGREPFRNSYLLNVQPRECFGHICKALLGLKGIGRDAIGISALDIGCNVNHNGTARIWRNRAIIQRHGGAAANGVYRRGITTATQRWSDRIGKENIGGKLVCQGGLR